MAEWERWRIDYLNRLEEQKKAKEISDWQEKWGKYFVNIPKLPENCGFLLTTATSSFDSNLPYNVGIVIYYDLNLGFPVNEYEIELRTPYNSNKNRRVVTGFELKKADAYVHPDFGGNKDFYSVRKYVWASNLFFNKRKLITFQKDIVHIPSLTPTTILPNFGVVIEEKTFEKIKSENKNDNVWGEKSRMLVRQHGIEFYERDNDGNMNRRKIKVVSVSELGLDIPNFTGEIIDSAELEILTHMLKSSQ